MEPISVTTYFKPAGEPVRLLVLHSTADSLGEDAVALLKQNLPLPSPIVAEHRVATFAALVSAVRNAPPFNVLLLAAHGCPMTHVLGLYGDVDVAGNPLSVNVGELKAALEERAADVLALFGVCYFGTGDLAEAVVNQAGAVACIAAKPSYAISKTDVGAGFGKLIAEICKAKAVPVGVQELPNLMYRSLSSTLSSNLSRYPA